MKAFTSTGNQAMRRCRGHAERLGHRAAATEHLLLALFEETSIARGVLVELGADVPVLMEFLEVQAAAGEGSYLREGSYSPHLRRGLAYAGRVARDQDAPTVTTGHVLAGLLLVSDELGDVAVAGFLQRVQISCEQLRAALAATRETED